MHDDYTKRSHERMTASASSDPAMSSSGSVGIWSRRESWRLMQNSGKSQGRLFEGWTRNGKNCSWSHVGHRKCVESFQVTTTRTQVAATCCLEARAENCARFWNLAERAGNSMR